MKVVHLDGYFDNPSGDFSVENAVLSAAGVTVHAPRTEVWDAAATADVVLVRAAVVGAAELQQLKQCKVLIRYGIGLDKIDLTAAARAGIAVCNVPDFCTSEMADHTFALALALARRLPEYQALARAQGWSLSRQYPIRGFSAMRFVTIGFGRIARQVLQRAQAFGFQVAAADPFAPPATMTAANVEPLSVEEAIGSADILSLHCPLTEDTAQLLGPQTFASMKPDAVLINTARGGLVDTAALTEALTVGQLRGAALDVTEPEPLPTEHPLYTMPNVIITPHMAWYSEEAEVRLRQMVAEEALRALRGEPLKSLSPMMRKLD